MWGWRRELTTLAVLAAVDGYAVGWLDAPAGHLAVAVLLTMVLAVPACRRLLCGWLRGGHLRWVWVRACRLGRSLATLNGRVPRVRRVVRVPAGERLALRLPGGLDPHRLEAAADRLAVALHAAEVRLDRDRRDAPPG